jgi:peptide/nickel transport system substrate-binding protein
MTLATLLPACSSASANRFADRGRRALATLAALSFLGVSHAIATTPAAQDALKVPSPEKNTGELVVAGPKPVDVFHPDRATPVTPLYGGRVTVHLMGMPESICYPIENSGETRRILYQVHETLMRQDWEYHDYRPNAAEELVIEDLLVLKEGAGKKYPGATDVRVARPETDGEGGLRAVRALYGRVAQGEGGYLVTPLSQGSDLPAATEVAVDDVDVVHGGSVFTFTLREGVRWHPSLVYAGNASAMERIGEQFLDPRDVQFSWSIYSNPQVDCGEKRYIFEKITDCRIVDARRVRFFYQEQFAFSLHQIGTSLTLLPAHLYDLSDPANPAHKADATALEQAEHINENPHNQLWVGLGPYRVTEKTQQYVQAERFTDAAGKPLYFDRDQAGYFDTLRWRFIGSDDTAMTALLNGELDYFDRIKATDYFGQRTRTELFERSFYKGHLYLGDYGYTGWNLYRPQLADRAVRIAIAHAFDFDEYLRTNYMGLARQTTGPVPYGTDGYPMDLKPFPYDPEKAIELMEDAGWYDRDGDGIADKDGVQLSIEFLFPAGSEPSLIFGTKLQESLKAIGIEVRLAQLEWAALIEKVKSRDFDSVSLLWIPPLEPDPEQIWHSRLGARDVRSSNNAGVCDPEVDEMIAGIQRELDVAKRMQLWHRFHRYLYLEVQPYLFGYNVPKRFAINRAIRGVQGFAIDPGYSLRRWYYSDPENSALRKTLER